MKRWLLLALVGGSAYTLPAQELAQTVIGSAGNYQSHPTVGNLHWTVGEIAVEEFQNEHVLSQGFQQGYIIDIVSAIGDETFYDEKLKVKVYPNPTSGWIQLETDLPGNQEIVMTDLLGQHLFTHMAAHTGEIIDLQPLPSGIYLLRIMQKGRPIRTYRIHKVDS